MLLRSLLSLLSFSFAYETKKEAALLARSILQSATLGELASIQSPSRPSVQSYPYSSVQYISDECPSTGNPFFLLVSWGTHATNFKLNQNASLFVRDSSWYQPLPPNDRGRMDHPRFTLFGKVREVEKNEYERYNRCFEEKNPDAEQWKDGHSFKYFQLMVEDVNFVGGYGDEHYVGWLEEGVYHALDYSRARLMKIRNKSDQ